MAKKYIDVDKTLKNLPDDLSYKASVKRVLMQAPEADAVEVKHGEWEDRPNPQWKAYDIRHCSKCGWNIPKNNLRKKDLNWKYCPNCGADMRGKINGEE